MTVCSNCGEEVTRSRVIWSESGEKREECVNCSPQNFHKFTVPSDQKIWMGYEAHPNEYEKKYDKDGLIYERKPEYRAEQEARIIQQANAEQDEKQRIAEEHKRKTRRTQEMDSVELASALRRAEEIAHLITQSAATGREVN